MHVSKDVKLKPHEIRTNLLAIGKIVRLLGEAMRANGFLRDLGQVKATIQGADSRYRNNKKIDALVQYFVRMRILLVDEENEDGRLYFDGDRCDVIMDAQKRGAGVVLPEPASARIAEFKRRWVELQRKLEAVRSTPVPPAPERETDDLGTIAEPDGESEKTSSPRRKPHAHKKCPRLNPPVGAEKVMYLTPDEEECWRREPWFVNPERYFVISIETRPSRPVSIRLGKLIAQIELQGFSVEGERVQEAFARLSKEVDPDGELNPSTSYLKLAGYRPDYPTNGWGVIFIWKKGKRILTGVTGYGRFTYVPMESPPKRVRRTVGTKRKVSPSASPAYPYSPEALMRLSDTELQAFGARVRAEIAARLDERQAILDAKRKKLAAETLAYANEEAVLKKDRHALLGDPDHSSLPN